MNLITDRIQQNSNENLIKSHKAPSSMKFTEQEQKLPNTTVISKKKSSKLAEFDSFMSEICMLF